MSSVCQRFIFENHNISGVLVQVMPALNDVLRCHHYPSCIETELSSTLLSSLLIHSRFKDRGELILQLHDGGSVSLLVAKCDQDLSIRGLAHYDMTQDEKQLSSDFAQGRLSVTYFKPNSDRPVQSVIDLSSSSIESALERYFLQSEQIPTCLKLDPQRGVGVLLQRMPSEQEVDNEKWHQLCEQLKSLEAELHDLDTASLLRVSFPQDDIRLFDEEPVRFKCPCSQEKMLNAVASLPQQELVAMIEEDGGVDMTCEYCSHQYALTAKELRSLLK